MNLHLRFCNINNGPNNKTPQIAVSINNNKIYTGTVEPHLDIECEDLPADSHNVNIEFLNKSGEDTAVDSNGNIVNDMNFELDSVVIDGVDLEELKWEGVYHAQDGQQFAGCMFFGPLGTLSIPFEIPALKYKLKIRNSKTDCDPDWEVDYNYYERACQILEQIHSN